MFPCDKPLGFLLSKGEHAIFHVHSDLVLGTYCAHAGKIGTDDKSAQVLTQSVELEKKEVPNPASSRS